MKEFKCEFCKKCIKQDKLNQIGLCIDEHAPVNCSGEHRRSVHLWSLGCQFREPITEKKRSQRMKPINIDWKKE